MRVYVPPLLLDGEVSSVRCVEHALVTGVHERNEVRWCASCAQIVHVGPRALRPPRPDELDDYLKAEVARATGEARERPWVEARILGYETVSGLAGLLHLQVAPVPPATWRRGEAVEFRGIDLRAPRPLASASVIESVEEDRLAVRVRANEGLARLVGKDWVQLEVRVADLTHLALGQLRVFQRLLADTDLVERLLDPARRLPRLDPWRPEEWPALAALDPAVAGNPDQARAYAHALRAPQDGLALVQGPPGTGKTRLLANVARALLARGRSVLVASHANVAVDNALERILDLDPALAGRMVRLGAPARVSRRVEPLWSDAAAFPLDWESDDPHATLFSSVFRARPLVGMTLATLTSRVARTYAARYERFDWVLVDEASMNLLPVVATALHVGKRVVLVGDHRQLPPIIAAPEYAARPGFSMGTFEHVARARPDLSVMLRRQHRSLPGIMDWSNEALYAGRLETVREGAPPAVRVGRALLEGPAAWVDTGALPGNRHVARALGREATPSFANPHHAALALRVAEALVGDGHRPEDIGFISPFRLQAALFHQLAAVHLDGAGIESSTVDAFQGREKRIVLYDVTTTTPQRSHESIQRLNVSLTRARDLLVVLGPRAFSAGPEANLYYHSLARWFDGRPVVDARLLDADAEALDDAHRILGEPVPVRPPAGPATPERPD